MPNYAGTYSGTWNVSGQRGVWSATIQSDNTYTVTTAFGTSTGRSTTPGVLSGTFGSGGQYRVVVNPRTWRANGTISYMSYRGTLTGRRDRALAKSNFGDIEAHALMPMVQQTGTDMRRFPDFADSHAGASLTAQLMPGPLSGEHAFLATGS